jgi:uncharacterized YccA/Bax inhibitor family protein
MIRTANPALNDKVFLSASHADSLEKMTIQGAVNKTGLLCLLAFLSAAFVWRQFFLLGETAVSGWMILGALGGFVFSLITIFKQTAAPITAPIYAILEGLFLGGISATFEKYYPGIVMQAIALTFGTLFALLLIYKSRLIKVTENFKLGLFAATGGIALIYFLSFILSFFGITVPYIYSSGTGGIIISLVIVVIAALNLVLDFDFIENAAERGAPKYMEWYAAFGLLVTLVWLYVEILRLLAKLNSRK